MDREGFRNRLKQYKKAREENPGLKYWEWKAQPAEKVIPKYDEGVGMVGTPSAGMADFNKNLVSLLSEATAKGFLNTVRRRLYDNLDPYNYSNLDLGERAQDRVINSVWKNKRDLQGLYYRDGEYPTERDDIFAEYLNIPKENRHKIYNSLGEDISNEKHLVIPSKYKPSKTKNNNVEYKTIDKIKDKDIVSSLDYRYNDLNFNENATVRNNLGKYFGYYTVGRGLDPKRGEYISVYDLWDINPFYGSSGSDSEDGNWLDKVIHKKVGNEDASLGIGKPIEFYDRVYLNDYYGVDSKPDKGQYYGGYIPEVEIRPETYDDGGIPTYDEGGRVIPTQEEYIAEQIELEKAAALAKSLSRTTPRVPKGKKTGERWNPVTKKVEDIHECGSSCAYTFADNYGQN